VSIDHVGRLARAAERAAGDHLAALLIPPSPDFAYLAGYDPESFERLSLLIVRADADATLLVPELERPLAAGSPIGSSIEILAWRDDEDPYGRVASLLPGGGRLAVGDRLWASHVLPLQGSLNGASFVPASSVMGALRAQKDEDELDALQRAADAADRTFADICGSPFEGRTEAEVAADLARLLVEHGHARADFTIVGSGPHGASPHHVPGSRTIMSGDAVVMDFGGELDGYFSDTTRTVVVREAPDGFAEVYDVVAEAQRAALDAVRPGVPAEEVDRAARSVIAAAGFGDRFVHRTGHGIGLEVHEPPYIVEGNSTPLAAGVTFSIEPGVYLEGRFGVRIEDIVVVTESGARSLNRSTRELQRVI
jgi:Xaa-Pro aminopeptidase